jgi:hypothetical protein
MAKINALCVGYKNQLMAKQCVQPKNGWTPYPSSKAATLWQQCAPAG